MTASRPEDTAQLQEKATLSIELWQNIFEHLDSEMDVCTMLDVMTVCKLFHSAMRHPFLHSIVIFRSRQIPLLLAYLLRNPTHARLVKQLRFTDTVILNMVREDKVETARLVNELSPIPFLLQLLVELRGLHNLPLLIITARSYMDTIFSMMALSKLTALTFARNPANTFGTASAVQFVGIHFLCDRMPMVTKLSLGKYQFNPLRTEQLSTPLASITVLILTSTYVDSPSLLPFFRLFPSLKHLQMEHCSEENTTDLVSAITICLPHLEELNILDSIESPRKPPEQHDYLKQMKSLKRIRLSPGCLAPDSLMHIGPALEDVTLYGQVLQAAELGFSLAIMEPACEMRISLWHSEYPLKDRSYLQTLCAGKARIKLSFRD